jgi:hypothetical protein
LLLRWSGNRSLHRCTPTKPPCSNTIFLRPLLASFSYTCSSSQC